MGGALVVVVADKEDADVGVIRGIGLFEPAHRVFHVRLAAAKPYFADEDIAVADAALLAGDGERSRVGGSLERVEVESPVALGVGGGRFCLGIELNGYGGARVFVCPAL